ncbi:hypothetical protein D3C84_542420 [compost metagenome]
MGAVGGVVSHQLTLIPTLQNKPEHIIATANRKVFVWGISLERIRSVGSEFDNFMGGYRCSLFGSYRSSECGHRYEKGAFFHHKISLLRLWFCAESR